MTNKIGTLAEIDPKVGDVVQYAISGGVSTITRIDAGKFYSVGESGVDGRLVEDEPFRIINRAPTSPVRRTKRTVDDVEIVPGVYGRVKVFREGNGEVLIGLVLRDGSLASTSVHWMNCAELTAAIDTLTQIRDAMQEGGE
jgi:hypothetical protein